LASGVGTITAGLLVWGAHWVYALRLVQGPDWRAADERRSQLRRLYLFAAAFTGLGLSLVAAVRLGTVLARELLNVPVEGGEDTGRRVFALALRLALFCALWVYHRRQVLAEADAFAGTATRATVRRLDGYGMALVGLATAAVGLARVLGLALDRAASASGTLLGGDAWKADLARFLTIALVGGALWLVNWNRVQNWLAVDPLGERDATVRRIYLYAVLAGAVVGLLAGLAVIIYRVLSAILDVSNEGGFLEDISTPLGVVVVTVAALAYHGVILYREASARPEDVRPATLALVLSGPLDADLDALAERLSTDLPEGYALRRAKG
jgi:hypothetical protein